ncbi:MAG: hypothetical protein GY894_03495 [Planctomycetes bacterium]|nr:hypothetical protein [Planctomycetota bacterium]MCP4838413.1 hypothetical protein [Planctomycetota bacterium]
MRRRCLAECLGLIGILLVTGCTLKGGGLLPSAAGTSSPLTWESTAACPKTIAIVDTRTGETVFELDIPLGEQLSIQFFEHKDPQKHPESPDIMRYTLLPLGRWVGALDESIEVPHAWNRRIDVFFRTPDSYTPPDPTREVVPLEVPLPDAKAADDGRTDTPAVSQPAPVVPAASPDAAKVPEPTDSTAPKAVPAPTPRKASGTRPHATMTWTDTGATRRVSVSDIKSGEQVFEVDVPAGHDLVLHFYTMWTPPSKTDDVEAMHWEIVPTGTSIDVPSHHATVPKGTRRRVSEQALAPKATPRAAGAPTPDTTTEAKPKTPPETPAEPSPPPVNLIDDEDEAKPAPASPQH